MNRARRVLRDETGAPRPLVYLRTFPIRRRPRGRWLTGVLLLVLLALAAVAATLLD